MSSRKFGCPHCGCCDCCREWNVCDCRREWSACECDCCRPKPQKKTVCNVKTTGPIYKDISTYSIISRAYNPLGIPVSVTMEIFSLDISGTETLLFTETKVIQQSQNTAFSAVDTSAPALSSFRIVFTTTDLGGRPVEGVQVYAAGRIDLASTTLENNNLVPSEIFVDSDFIPVCVSVLCCEEEE